MNINKLLISTSLVAGALLAAPAWSVNLTSVGSYALPGTTVAARPELAGTVLPADGNSPTWCAAR